MSAPQPASRNGSQLQVLGENIDFAANLRYSLRRYALWWMLLAATMALDFLTTLGFVSVLGVVKEANGLARFLMHGMGVPQGLALAKLLQLFAVTAIVSLNRRVGNVFLMVVVLLNCWAVVVNSV